MTIIADSSFIYALSNPKDSKHQTATEFASVHREETLVPEVVLPEIAYLFRRDVGTLGIPYFLKRFQEFETAPLSLEQSNLAKISEISET